MQLGSPHLTELFHNEYGEPIYFGVKRSKIKVTSYEDIAGVGLGTISSAGFYFSVPFAVFFCYGSVR